MDKLGHCFYNTHYQCHRLFKHHGPTKYMILKFPNFQLGAQKQQQGNTQPKMSQHWFETFTMSSKSYPGFLSYFTLISVR